MYYSDNDIITIFKNCRNYKEVMRAALAFKILEREGVQPNISFVQYRALMKLNQITDDGN